MAPWWQINYYYEKNYANFSHCICFNGFLWPGNDLDKGQVNYIPSKENLKNREWFQDAHFGMFIHFGVSSVLGEEIGWALSGKDVNEYKQNIHRFNPAKFDAASVVKLAKDAGMKYITFTTRHHDSFSMFKTKYSDWSIMNTPYHEDVLKMLADECHKQGIRLFCYYSLADFCRADYCQGNVKKRDWNQGRMQLGRIASVYEKPAY
ncbi:MAG: alpha-L-fucosidase [Bacteroidales bacterium]|nr:alpha-L-fucosidase [Bacteroidales bacterium]